MKLLLLSLLVFLGVSCASRSIIYVSCKYTDPEQVKISIQTQLRSNQKMIKYRKIDTGMYEVTIKEYE